MAAVGQRNRHGTRAGTRALRRIPLSLVIARYFLYVFAALVAVWVASFIGLSMAINAGGVYPASYGAAHAREEARALRQAGTFDADALPTAYRYALLDETGAVLRTDLSDARLDEALRATAEARSGGWDGSAEVLGADGATYAVCRLADGSVCILASVYLPQYVSRGLRDALPNPQNLMIACGCIGSAAAIALVARRASVVLTRKMAPLTEAAERIAREDLDAPVASSNVRQVDDVLSAMERMRVSLRESLEARWRAERAQRDQMAALAHDLKTPLTVVRANAEYLAEELEAAGNTEYRGCHACDAGRSGAPGHADGAAGHEDASDASARYANELAAAARDAVAGTERLDGYLRLLIEASRGESAALCTRSMDARDAAERLASGAETLARATGIRLVGRVDESLAGHAVDIDEDAIGRAVENIVSNALDHAQSCVQVSILLADGMFELRVADDGPGFSPEALTHACERFYRDDSARSSSSGAHYGIGLFTAAACARAHGGELVLANRDDGNRTGARVTLRIPCM